MEKEILILLAILMQDNIHQQIYAQQIKLLFDMLEREQLTYCQDNSYPIPGINKKILKQLKDK